MTNGDSFAGSDGGSGGIPGGRVKQNVSSEDIKELAIKGLTKINAQSNSAHLIGLAEIVKAESQVVSGVLYILTLRVGKTDCLKNFYTVKIWQQPWKNSEQITITEGLEED
uniref:Cystatin domain-containing protein n=1 Tax=Meloidogyne hapla TaxID=6305 RepID=A0A1I8BQ46_MELHA